ncbi:type I methionyl aminopeptidase [Plantibacter sp. VKM Ac-2880]|uniref:type I methionyl aminopeptidase n=1 Tax=Plantibacter sp. VKM Ac-2880 TaxID=2783827 RepID=UPI00188F17BC|nr:type I methionyl aminopeptidase [Plantibacter sp. VKM Ac-2880]MBF4569184.1 type I methionyl aminopeptidase [Plantibacter sp. VKM Ac-2880]
MPFDSAGHLIPGLVGRPRTVPATIARPEYVGRAAPAADDRGDLYTPEEIERIRVAGTIAADAIQAVGAAVRPGVTTDELDAIGHAFVVGAGAYPSTLGYRGYPKSICSSVNEVICHGIPDDTALRDGDLINIDITAYLDGVHGDSNVTFLIGDAAEETRLLVERTREALNRGIKAVAPGRQINVIGRAIESYAKRFGYGVVRDFTGHGVGRSFHSGLIVPHYDAAPQYDTVMEVGMVFTIEPMLTIGAQEWEQWDDDWTVTTRDRSLTAQFEHTLVVTERGAEVLTLPSGIDTTAAPRAL